MQVFSPNMLKTFAECEKKYEFKYIKKITVPQPVSVFEKGKKIHALAHYYLRGDDIEKFLPTLTDEEKNIWQKLLNNEYFQKKYINSEYNLTARIGEYWVGGRLDAFMKDENNYYILDYKTGSIPKDPQTDFQTMVYLMCADKKLKNYNLLKFVYIDLKNDQNTIIELTPERKNLYTKVLTEICKRITEETEYPQKTDSCSFCEYSKLCFYE